MQTYTTKVATDLLYADDFRSNGCPDVWCHVGTIFLRPRNDSCILESCPPTSAA